MAFFEILGVTLAIAVTACICMFVCKYNANADVGFDAYFEVDVVVC